MGWMWDVRERQQWRMTLKGLTSDPGKLQAGKHEKVAELGCREWGDALGHIKSDMSPVI